MGTCCPRGCGRQGTDVCLRGFGFRLPKRTGGLAVKDAPKYPEGFRDVQNGLRKVKINRHDILDKLRGVENGEWKKVIEMVLINKGIEYQYIIFNIQKQVKFLMLMLRKDGAIKWKM